jgi:ribosomal protein S18 acetylase RimI-like enzyme
MKMVMTDIANPRAHDGIYCGIWDQYGVQIGVLDFCLETDKEATLLLLVISKSYRNRGHGKRIVPGLESYLKRKYGIEEIRSGVQVNNTGGIIFWRKMGFKISNTPMDMGDGTVAYEMRKRI